MTSKYKKPIALLFGVAVATAGYLILSRSKHKRGAKSIPKREDCGEVNESVPPSATSASDGNRETSPSIDSSTATSVVATSKPNSTGYVEKDAIRQNFVATSELEQERTIPLPVKTEEPKQVIDDETANEVVQQAEIAPAIDDTEEEGEVVEEPATSLTQTAGATKTANVTMEVVEKEDVLPSSVKELESDTNDNTYEKEEPANENKVEDSLVEREETLLTEAEEAKATFIDEAGALISDEEIPPPPPTTSDTVSVSSSPERLQAVTSAGVTPKSEEDVVVVSEEDSNALEPAIDGATETEEVIELGENIEESNAISATTETSPSKKKKRRRKKKKNDASSPGGNSNMSISMAPTDENENTINQSPPEKISETDVDAIASASAIAAKKALKNKKKRNNRKKNKGEAQTAAAKEIQNFQNAQEAEN